MQSAELDKLQDLIYRELDLRDLAHQQVHTGSQEALRIAHRSMVHRLDSMNEFRAAMAHQSATFVTRSENAAIHVGVQDRLDQLNASMKALELSHSTLQARLYAIVSVVTVGMTAVSVMMALFR